MKTIQNPMGKIKEKKKGSTIKTYLMNEFTQSRDLIINKFPFLKKDFILNNYSARIKSVLTCLWNS